MLRPTKGVVCLGPMDFTPRNSYGISRGKVLVISRIAESLWEFQKIGDGSNFF